METAAVTSILLTSKDPRVFGLAHIAMDGVNYPQCVCRAISILFSFRVLSAHSGLGFLHG